MNATKEIEKNTEEMKELDLEIRPATPDDFDILTDISRVCFPEQLRWKTFKSHNRKWWDLLIKSQFCEIWVCSVYGQVIAYTAIVFDRIKYEDAWEKQRLSLLNLIYIFTTYPMQSLKRAYIKLQLKRMGKNRGTAKPSNKETKLNTYEKIMKYFTENNPWLGPIAVLPGMRGKSVATKILEYCLLRLKTLDYKSAYAIVKRKNIQSKGLFERRGFVIIGEADYVLFYKKNLDAK